jgi:hypothetical protein
VIDTVGTKTDRPFAMIDLFGTPFTEKLHVVERYRLRLSTKWSASLVGEQGFGLDKGQQRVSLCDVLDLPTCKAGRRTSAGCS